MVNVGGDGPAHALRRRTHFIRLPRGGAVLRARGWAPVREMPLPNGRRADILALQPDGGFAVVR
jgi:hypothetical protein